MTRRAVEYNAQFIEQALQGLAYVVDRMIGRYHRPNSPLLLPQPGKSGELQF